MKQIEYFPWREWDAGLLLFLWKWLKIYQSWDWEGQRHYAIGNFHRFLRPQDPSKTEEDQTNMKKKVDKVRKRMYIYTWNVLSLSHMFYVRKGLNDIWMVYNGTSYGLSLALWAPHFGLPIVQHNLRALLPGYSQCNMDAE